ncbi:5-hydroxytryptamine receptor 3A-like [Fundulus heteroclitus]|uniref:5-hydroxytryptamine receptor 3A-like n=1 Tax=Fundulus heteroclitus TaxID=8078 RepID=UPI00165B9441|nr:5-hydroxytryptamine receptor 3A-like [Fundulus heteroclitus]
MASLRTLTLLALAAGFSCSRASDCSYFGLLNHLNMDTANTALGILRPVKNWTTTTLVQLDMILNGILDVNEKFQTVTNHIWINMFWINEFLTWNSSEFCGMNMLTIPSSMLWIPDIIIYEDASDCSDSKQDPLVTVDPSGLVRMRTRLMLTISCKFNLYRFPFDTQTCNITFLSLNYDDSVLKLGSVTNASILTEVSEHVMQTEGEWKLTNIESITSTATQKSQLIYRVSLQRKPFLYIINLILPLLFLLFLDVASFFLCESSSAKVNFKVTILLSIFVLLLILKDILPSTEEALPVMAIYCVSVFTLVWINVLETMLMSFLNGLSCCVGEEANASEVFKVKTQQEADNPKESAGDAGAANPEASNPPLGPLDGGGLLKRILGKEKAALKPPGRQEEDAGRTGCRWLRLVKIFDNVFFVLYFTTVVISQVFMFMLWNVPDLLG